MEAKWIDQSAALRWESYSARVSPQGEWEKEKKAKGCPGSFLRFLLSLSSIVSWCQWRNKWGVMWLELNAVRHTLLDKAATLCICSLGPAKYCNLVLSDSLSYTFSLPALVTHLFSNPFPLPSETKTWWSLWVIHFSQEDTRGSKWGICSLIDKVESPIWPLNHLETWASYSTCFGLACFNLK